MLPALLHKTERGDRQHQCFLHIFFLQYTCKPDLKHIKKIIYHNQAGFIPMIQGCFRMHKLTHVINYKRSQGQK